MKKIIFFAVFFILLSFGFVESSKENKIDSSISESFNSGEEEVKVIVNLDESEKNIYEKFILDIFSDSKEIEIDEEKMRHRFDDSFSAEINSDDLDKLEKNPQVKSIVKMEKIYALLQDSVGIVNASNSWNLQSQEINFTGLNQVVCVIDTGMNYSNSDLNASYVAGHDYIDDDEDPMDGHGHGTHVAGIIAANGSVRGVAPGAGLVIIRVLDDNGGGYVDDLISGIDWCVNNATQFNISVISVSLGCNATLDGYTSVCDGINDGCGNTLLANSINNAVSNGISVIAASGNYGNSTAVSSPACIENTTAVSSTTKSDSISSFSNRNSIVRLFAPGGDGTAGGSINSTRWNPSSCSPGCSCTDDYMVCSGTSMATPMVSGAVAVLKQFLNLTNQQKNSSEIEELFYDKGLQFSEDSNNFSRINLYQTIISLDNIAPSVVLDSPVNGRVDNTVNQTFVCNTTDWQLANITFQIWNETDLYYESSSVDISGIENQSTFDLADMSGGSYSWNCISYDSLGNYGLASGNNSLTIGGISVTLISPNNESYTDTNETNFTCQIISEQTSELSNVTFYLWDIDGNISYNESRDISGFDNTSEFIYNLSSEGNYSWNCLGFNNNSNSSFGLSNFTVIFDGTFPGISDLGSSVDTTSAIVTWNTDELTNSSVNGSGIDESSNEYSLSHSLSISSLSAGTTYEFTVVSCDLAGNCNSSSGSFTTSSISVSNTVNSGGGGGGGSGNTSTTTSSATESVEKLIIIEGPSFYEGINKVLKKSESVKFGLSSGNHTLSILEIFNNSARISIESESLIVEMFVGQEEKFNLSSLDYYDFYVRLNNINSNTTNITIKRIFEEIYLIGEDEFPENISEEKTLSGNLQEKFIQFRKTIDLGEIIIAISVLILAFVIYYTRKKLKRSKASE